MRRPLLPLIPLLTLGLTPIGPAAEPESLKGFTPLFNYRDMTGWKVRGSRLNWGFEEGVLYTTGGANNFLISNQQYADFELRFNFTVPPSGVSGLILRAPLVGDPAYAGLEIPIQDDSAFPKLKLTDRTGSLFGVAPASKQVLKEPESWNQMFVRAQGRRITVELNEAIVVDVDLDRYKHLSEKHPGLLRASGHLGLRSQTGRVEFYDMFIKPLPAKSR